MRIFRRRQSIEETMELLRLSSSECSGLGLEEEDEIEVVQTPASTKETRMTTQPQPSKQPVKAERG